MDREIINQLEIPTGFRIEQLVNMKSNDIAKDLNIDEDVAPLIGVAVKKYVEERQRKPN